MIIHSWEGCSKDADMPLLIHLTSNKIALALLDTLVNDHGHYLELDQFLAK